MNKIEFYTDQDGTKPVSEFLTSYLKAQGTRSRNWRRLYLLVLRGLVYLRNAVISDIINVDITLPDEGDGAGDYEITLVKDLTGYHPLLEFRINVPGAGAARIVFIEYLQQGETYLVMMRAVVKQSNADPAFIAIRDEAHGLLPDFLKAPHQYTNIPEQESE